MEINEPEDGLTIEYLKDMISKIETVQKHFDQTLINLREVLAFKIEEENLMLDIFNQQKGN